jgi:uncharacterized protein (DUF2252 family)
MRKPEMANEDTPSVDKYLCGRFNVKWAGDFNMANISIPSLQTRLAEGKRLRDKMQRVDQGNWKARDGREVLGTIKAATEGRLPELIPIKMSRMSLSPFSFFRGTASLMAKDLSGHPTTGLDVQLCGDAHVKNLGAYAAPDGRLVFDLNDFDETIRGPWEWDLKRLAASVVLAGRDAGEGRKDCELAVQELARWYRESLDLFARMKVLELARYEIRRQSQEEVVRDIMERAEHVTPAKTLKKLTEPTKEGWRRFHDQPPALRHVPDSIRTAVFEALKAYRETVTAGRQLILDAYQPVDVAFKMVGTGSIGTRDYIVLLFGNGIEDPMFLQLKEELKSCYAPYVSGVGRIDHEGRRVANEGRRAGHEGRRAAQGQQRMQTVTDPFLGWATIEGRHFLVRQLADHKAEIDPEELKGASLLEYAVVCGKVLAKAHARTGDAAALAGYCGHSVKFDEAIGKFALVYADQTARDYEVFLKAIKAGKIRTAPPS